MKMIEAFWEWNLFCWQVEGILLAFGFIPALWVWLDHVASVNPDTVNVRFTGQRCDQTNRNYAEAQRIVDELRPGMMTVLPEGASVVYPVYGRKPRVVMRPTQRTSWQ